MTVPTVSQLTNNSTPAKIAETHNTSVAPIHPGFSVELLDRLSEYIRAVSHCDEDAGRLLGLSILSSYDHRRFRYPATLVLHRRHRATPDLHTVIRGLQALVYAPRLEYSPTPSTVAKLEVEAHSSLLFPGCESSKNLTRTLHNLRRVRCRDTDSFSDVELKEPGVHRGLIILGLVGETAKSAGGWSIHVDMTNGQSISTVPEDVTRLREDLIRWAQLKTERMSSYPLEALTFLPQDLALPWSCLLGVAQVIGHETFQATLQIARQNDDAPISPAFLLKFVTNLQAAGAEKVKTDTIQHNLRLAGFDVSARDISKFVVGLGGNPPESVRSETGASSKTAKGYYLSNLRQVLERCIGVPNQAEGH